MTGRNTDERVESLRYTHTLASDTRRFRDGFQQVIHLGEFHCRVDTTNLVALPVDDYSTVEEAQADLEPHLRAWELRSSLILNVPLSFRKAGHLARSGNRNQNVGLGAVEVVTVVNEVRAIVTMSRIQVPSGGPVRVSEEVASLRDRWREVATGSERLLVGSYWVLTELERYHGSRTEVVSTLQVSKKALDTLGRLSALNDPRHGRKAKMKPVALTSDEIGWIKAFVPLLIIRAAEIESDLTGLPQLTMADLPDLEGQP